VKPSFALVLLAFTAASAVASACTQRHRLGGRYEDGAGGEAGATSTPPGSFATPSAGGSGATPSGGASGSGASGGAAAGSGSGGNAGVSGAEQQPDPGLLL
jgi:hypothetical protein